MKKQNNSDQQVLAQENNLDDLNKQLNGMIKKIMGRRTASTIAKSCGVSVSTITRIRNGENKRGINEDLLHKIWKNRDSNCDIDLSQLLSLNSDVYDAYRQREDVKWNQDQQEIDFLEKQIQKSIFNSGVFLRKIKDPYVIIPDIVLFPEMSYEIAFENGERRRVLFFTQFYSKRKIEQMEKRSKEYHDDIHFYCRHYRSVLDFREMRALHSEYENSELVIVFNNEDVFRYNVDTLKKLSNRDRVTLVLINSDRGNLLEEVCLDGRKKGVIKELGLLR